MYRNYKEYLKVFKKEQINTPSNMVVMGQE